MPEPTSTPDALATSDRDALRIVLFGMPDAGKSSLLGALAQAAQTQEYLLNGHLADSSGGLAELHDRLYDEKPRETLEEVVPYPVTFEPFATQNLKTTVDRTEAVLVDCDGRVANELLTQRRALTAERTNSELAKAILAADALLLVVDASAGPSQIDTDFREFGRFLRLLEQSRGRRSDVGGLPVFLVLAKCDLLAQPGDTLPAWIERIEERKRQVDARFREFLARQQADGPLPFGRINLHLWATAVKRPELAGSPARPREPYGVAELFRQSFALARVFQQRRNRSGRRLVWTVAGGTGAVAVMAGLLTALLVSRPQEQPGVQELATKVESYRAREPQTASTRLREPLQRKISELTELDTDPQFSHLSQGQQDYVRGRLKELQDYQAYEEKLQALPPIEQIHSQRELDDLETRLKRLDVPAEHRPEWNQTDAALFHARLLEDAEALRKAVSETEDWYNALIRRGQELWSFAGRKPGAPIAWPDWQRDVQTLLAEAEAPPHRPTDKLARTSLTYRTVLQFESVAVARTSWETIRHRLERVRAVSAALGLAGTPPGRASLDIPAGFQAEQAAGRLQELEKLDPHFQQDFTLAELPEVIVGEIQRAAQTRYERAIKAGQEVVLRHLLAVASLPAGGGNKEGWEAPQTWARLEPWLTNPEDLKAWRVLATVLARLHDPTAEDPVTVLAAFLRKQGFDLVLRRITLEIPDDVKVRPQGNLAVHHFSGGERTPPLIFEPTGEERHDARRRVARYAFQPVGESSLRYKPGDILWADLPVENGGSPGWMLTWARNRSQVYQFERLVQPPRLHLKDKANTEGEIEEGISLEMTPEGGVPKVPDLMPVVPVTLEKP